MPLLKEMCGVFRSRGEPHSRQGMEHALAGIHIQDKVWSMHSWCRAAVPSKAVNTPRAGDPNQASWFLPGNPG
jgi:hypothetical protein